jgi:hypothetical protein
LPKKHWITRSGTLRLVRGMAAHDGIAYRTAPPYVLLTAVSSFGLGSPPN